MMKRLVSAALLAALLGTGSSVANGSPTSDGKPCPHASSLVTIRHLKDAVLPAKRYAGPGRWDVVELTRGPRGSLAESAVRACGAAVVRRSVFVRLKPHGRVCNAPCDVSPYVVRSRSGRYRVWFTGY